MDAAAELLIHYPSRGRRDRLQQSVSRQSAEGRRSLWIEDGVEILKDRTVAASIRHGHQSLGLAGSLKRSLMFERKLFPSTASVT